MVDVFVLHTILFFFYFVSLFFSFSVLFLFLAKIRLELEDNKTRKCFFCGDNIYKKEFLLFNKITVFNKEHLESLWNSPYVSIQCCRCNTFLRLITSKEVKILSARGIYDCLEFRFVAATYNQTRRIARNNKLIKKLYPSQHGNDNINNISYTCGMSRKAIAKFIETGYLSQKYRDLVDGICKWV